MKKKYIIFLMIFSLIFLCGCKKEEKEVVTPKDSLENKETDQKQEKEKNSLDEFISSLTIDEKIGQMILLMAPVENKIRVLTNYPVAGFVYGYNETISHTKESLKEEIESFQKISHIPIFLAVDEEGGTVTRISHNKNFTSTFFESPKKIYQEKGFDGIIEDIKEKSSILEEVGFLMNFAPVLDVVTDKNSYMWQRSFSDDYDLTSEYATKVIKTSKNYKVSYTLKHFPGHGNYGDTHGKKIIDEKSLDEYIQKDFKPFVAGISAGAEAIMLDHIIMSSLDNENPASISKNVINYLKNELHFDGLVISDALNMINDENKYIKAVSAGNDLIILGDFYSAFEEIKRGLEEGTLKMKDIEYHVKRVLEWKIKKGLLKL